jgi:hypothetical protein
MASLDFGELGWTPSELIASLETAMIMRRLISIVGVLTGGYDGTAVARLAILYRVDILLGRQNGSISSRSTRYASARTYRRMSESASSQGCTRVALLQRPLLRVAETTTYPSSILLFHF